MERNLKQIIGILIAFIMIASAVFIIGQEKKVDAAGPTWIQGTLSISYPGDGKDISGTVRIAWSGINVNGSAVQSQDGNDAAGCKPLTYNVTINALRAESGNYWKHYEGGTSVGNRSANNGNATYFDWNTRELPDGEYFINVTGGFADGVHGNAWKNATTVKVVVRNSLQRTPGVDQYQGAKWSIQNHGYNATKILSVEHINYEVGNSYSISLNTGLNWGSSTYYLFYPVYKGTTTANSSNYDLEWHRYPPTYSATATNPNFGTIAFTGNYSRAGLWLISTDTTHIESTSDFSTISQYNSTVKGWFWVNTSTDYTLEDLPDSFLYNASSASLTLTVKDENGEQPASDTDVPVVDIRRDDNGSSIRGQNMLVNTWVYSGYYKNNSYDTGGSPSFPGDNGFWSAGNYTAMAYIDTDSVETTGYDGMNYYTQNTMGLGAAGNQHYNETYGASQAKNASDSWLSTASKYNWAFCGPWDPPEHNVTQQRIAVKSNTLSTSVTENSTVYYGFDGSVNITVRERANGPKLLSNDNGKLRVEIWDDDNENVTSQFYIKRSSTATPTRNAGTIDVSHVHDGAGYILINMTKWGINQSHNGATGTTEWFGNNGTWDLIIIYDHNQDRVDYHKTYGDDNVPYSEEFNKTVNWKVRKAPTAQFKWIDDDGSITTTSTENTDGVIPYIPPVASVPLDVEFKVLDQLSGTFGDLDSEKHSGKCISVRECAENITISGNTLFTGKLSDFPGFGLGNGATIGYSGGIWSVPIIPTMSSGGGSITFRITAYNTSITKTLQVGGSKYAQNGSIIEIQGGKDSFMIDQENQTITVSVTNADTGAANTYGYLYLYYIDDGATAANGGTGTAANACNPIEAHQVKKGITNSGGTYTFWFNQTQQTTNQTTAGFGSAKAPRNLTVYFSGPGGANQYNGYALIQMDPVNDLEVHLSQNTIMAGYEYDGFTFSCDKAGNSTDTPRDKTADKNAFYMKIYDSDHNDVTTTLFSSVIDQATDLNGAYSFSFDSLYATEPGTYTVYAYNNTHNTKDYNATLEVKPVVVSCDKNPFVWKADKNISATFTATYNGSITNGSLVIDNMTDKGSYNKTWANCSFDGNSDAAGNTSLEIDSTYIDKGVVTVSDITADTLHPTLSKQYITFWWKPVQSDGNDGQYAKCKFDDGSGTLKNYMEVQIPSVTPDPQYIPLGRTTRVYTTVTGRGTNLENVFVRLHGCGYDKNSTSDVDGRVQFSVSPSTTGNISIDVGQEGRTLAKTMVYVTSWVLDVSTDKVEVNEGNTFTITAMKEGTTEYAEGATVTISGIGTGTTDANGQATFTAPSVTSDRTFTVVVEKVGYAPEPNPPTVTVINIPKLTITLSGDTDDDGNYISPITIAVSNDVGTLITGATVTITGTDGTATTKTTVDGQVTFTVTHGEAKQYTIDATFGGFEAASTETITIKAAGTPGFELLTLVAALGVALILLRRRRK